VVRATTQAIRHLEFEISKEAYDELQYERRSLFIITNSLSKKGRFASLGITVWKPRIWGYTDTYTGDPNEPSFLQEVIFYMAVAEGQVKRGSACFPKDCFSRTSLAIKNIAEQ
jgi:hypothetical protein